MSFRAQMLVNNTLVRCRSKCMKYRNKSKIFKKKNKYLTKHKLQKLF